jgi:hypothetical protein
MFSSHKPRQCLFLLLGVRSRYASSIIEQLVVVGLFHVWAHPNKKHLKNASNMRRTAAHTSTSRHPECIELANSIDFSLFKVFKRFVSHIWSVKRFRDPEMAELIWVELVNVRSG